MILFDQTNSSGSLPWFALKVKSRHEKMVSLMLRNKGFEEFLPVYQGRHRSSGRIKTVELPLFPTYTFCRFDPLRRLPILTVPGVVSVVGVARQPVPVEAEEISAIERVVRSGLESRPWPYLSVGERVVIEEGPLQDLEGLLVQVKNERRLVVSVHLLQRSVAVEIDSFSVRPVRRRPFLASWAAPAAVAGH